MMRHSTFRFGALAALITIGVVATCAAQAKRIPIQILEPPERTWTVKDWPVTVGLVFPEGELKHARDGRVMDDRGTPVRAEVEVTGWWSAKRTRPKWLLLRFKASTDRKYFFEVGKPFPLVAEAAKPPVARKRGRDVVVDTGPLQLRLDARKPGLLSDVTLNGRAMPMQATKPLTLTALSADGKREIPTTLKGWTLKVEASGLMEASVKGTGYYTAPDGKRIARLELRWEFRRDEAFVRLYHTLVWMVRDPKVGVRANAFTLAPTGMRQLHVGLSDTGDREFRPTPGKDAVVVQQDQAEHYAVTRAGKGLYEGTRLGGWVALSKGDVQVSVSLRHASQMFPAAFRHTPEGLSVEFVPSSGPPLSFMPDGIMPPDFYHSNIWKRFWWSKEAGHHVNEYSVKRKRDGTIIPNRYFVNTPEGAARTHELVIGFHDAKPKRTPAQLNALTQHPVVLRQDPASAMRVPFMGMQIMPVKKEKYPNVERALDMLSKLPFARFARQHDFGYLRFGKVLWGDRPQPNTSLYRWMDNLQYDQQLLPWLFFMRGGGRRLYEDGEIAARYAMDMNTNHYNTRNMPTGFQATCGGGMPFPNLGFMIWNQKGVKIHFLSYYYHLTGYRRAKDVMDEVIAGNKKFVTGWSDEVERRHSSGREIYNMNMFWCNAWQETWDPAIKKLMDESRHFTATREYRREFNTFRGPRVYLFMGMLFQHHVSKDLKLAEVMLRHLAADVLPPGAPTGVRSVANTAACPWAYEQTRDMRYALAGWDVARRLSDLVSEADLAGERPPQYAIRGNMFYRHFILPILTNVSMADRLGLKEDAPPVFRDLFVYLETGGAGDKSLGATAWVRARRNGDLKLPVVIRHRNGVPVTVSAVDGKGAAVADLTLTVGKGERSDRWFSRNGMEAQDELTIRGARKGAVYKVLFKTTGRNAKALVLGAADVVFEFKPNAWHAVQPLSGGQGYSGVRFFTKTTKDEITFAVDANIFHRPHTIRDAATGKLLHRHDLGQPLERRHKLGKDRAIAILMAGQRALRGWKADGLSPYISATKDAWFDPTKP